MARHVRLREFLVGVEGLALLRDLFTGSDESAHQRIAERRCIEPCFGHAEVEMQQPAAAFVPGATEAAYLDLPAALVWDLAKDG
jgi:hypothetical protein